MSATSLSCVLSSNILVTNRNFKATISLRIMANHIKHATHKLLCMFADCPVDFYCTISYERSHHKIPVTYPQCNYTKNIHSVNNKHTKQSNRMMRRLCRRVTVVFVVSVECGHCDVNVQRKKYSAAH